QRSGERAWCGSGSHERAPRRATGLLLLRVLGSVFLVAARSSGSGRSLAASGGRRGTRRRSGSACCCARSRSLFGAILLGSNDRDDRLLCGQPNLDALGELEVLRGDRVAELERRHVSLELERDAVREAAHGDRAVHLTDKATLRHTDGL